MKVLIFLIFSIFLNSCADSIASTDSKEEGTVVEATDLLNSIWFVSGENSLHSCKDSIDSVSAEPSLISLKTKDSTRWKDRGLNIVDLFITGRNGCINSLFLKGDSIDGGVWDEFSYSPEGKIFYEGREVGNIRGSVVKIEISNARPAIVNVVKVGPVYHGGRASLRAVGLTDLKIEFHSSDEATIFIRYMVEIGDYNFPDMIESRSFHSYEGKMKRLSRP